MYDDHPEEKMIVLFEETGEAHHEAFLDTDGADPEWPTWYANYLHGDLSELLDSKFTKSELIYLLVTVDRELAAEAPGASWPAYYAGFFATRYG